MSWSAEIALACLLVTACSGPPQTRCEGGSWRPRALEIHHLDLGQADATLIVGPTGRSLLIDAGETRWDGDDGARTTGAYLRGVLGCARLDQVLITHFHLDHVGYPGKGGLWHLVERQGFGVDRLLHRDVRGHRGDSGGTADRWLAYLEGEGRRLHPEVVREGMALDLGPGVGVRIVGADGHGGLLPGDFHLDRAPPNENDYSVALLLRFGRLDYFIGGDLSGEWSISPYGYAYHDIESLVARGLPDIDVYRADHHGSEHSSNPTLLAQLQPEVSIVSAGDGNPYGHPASATIDGLAKAGVLYLTERGAARESDRVRVAGPVVLRSLDGITYSVNGDLYTATDPPRIDADGDGYFRQADPDDSDASVVPKPRGGCDPLYQPCFDSRLFRPMDSSVPETRR
jgi:beta-lactamase superfamily II metal-dependent hydrolase